MTEGEGEGEGRGCEETETEGRREGGTERQKDRNREGGGNDKKVVMPYSLRHLLSRTQRRRPRNTCGVTRVGGGGDTLYTLHYIGDDFVKGIFGEAELLAGGEILDIDDSGLDLGCACD